MIKKRTVSVIALLLVVVLAACGAEALETSAPAQVPQTENTQLPTESAAPEVPDETTAVLQPVESTAQTEVPEQEQKEPSTTPTAEQTQATELPTESLEPMPEDTAPPMTVVPETKPAEKTEFEKYNEMSAEEQEAFFNSFETPEAFFEWYNTAKEEYEKANPPVIIDGSTNIEIKP